MAEPRSPRWPATYTSAFGDTLTCRLLVALVDAVAVTANQCVPFGRPEIFLHHLLHQILKAHTRAPAKLRPGFARIAQQRIDFSGTVIAGIHGNDTPAVCVVTLLGLSFAAPRYAHLQLHTGSFHELAHA